MSTPGSIGPATSVRYSVLRLLRAPSLAALELEHELAKQRVQALLLAIGQGGSDQRFAGGFGPGRLQPRLLAGLGQLDEHAAAIGRIRQALDETVLLEAVESVRHCPALELGELRELASRPAERSAGSPQGAEDFPFLPGQPVLGQRVVEAASEPPAEAVHPIDDALDRKIEVGDLLQPGAFQEAVDVVALLCLLHGHILNKKILDVKNLDCYLLVVRCQDTSRRREAQCTRSIRRPARSSPQTAPHVFGKHGPGRRAA